MFAFSYQNQKEVAEGIKRAFKDIPGLKREDLFIVSGRGLKICVGAFRYLIFFRLPSCGTGTARSMTLSPGTLDTDLLQPAPSRGRRGFPGRLPC